MNLKTIVIFIKLYVEMFIYVVIELAKQTVLTKLRKKSSVKY